MIEEYIHTSGLSLTMRGREIYLTTRVERNGIRIDFFGGGKGGEGARETGRERERKNSKRIVFIVNKSVSGFCFKHNRLNAFNAIWNIFASS